MFRLFSIVLCVAACLFVGCTPATQNQSTAAEKRLPHVVAIESIDSVKTDWRWKIEYDDRIQSVDDVQPVIAFLTSVTPGVGKFQSVELTGKFATLTMKSGTYAKSATRLKNLKLVATLGRAMAQYEMEVSPFFNKNTGNEFAKRIGVLDGFQRGHIEDADDGITVVCAFEKTSEKNGTVTLTYKGGPYVGK